MHSGDLKEIWCIQVIIEAELIQTLQFTYLTVHGDSPWFTGIPPTIFCCLGCANLALKIISAFVFGLKISCISSISLFATLSADSDLWTDEQTQQIIDEKSQILSHNSADKEWQFGTKIDWVMKTVTKMVNFIFVGKIKFTRQWENFETPFQRSVTPKMVLQREL